MESCAWQEATGWGPGVGPVMIPATVGSQGFRTKQPTVTQGAHTKGSVKTVDYPYLLIR